MTEQQSAGKVHFRAVLSDEDRARMEKIRQRRLKGVTEYVSEAILEKNHREAMRLAREDIKALAEDARRRGELEE